MSAIPAARSASPEENDAVDNEAGQEAKVRATRDSEPDSEEDDRRNDGISDRLTLS